MAWTWGNPSLTVDTDVEKRELEIDASDAISGINRVVYRYRPDGSASWSSEIRLDATYWRDGTVFVFNRIGDYEIKVTAYDNAGNSTEHLTGVQTWGSPSEIGGAGGAGSDGSGGTGSTVTEGSAGLLSGDINVSRQVTPTAEIIIINGVDNDGSSFDRKILEELFED